MAQEQLEKVIDELVNNVDKEAVEKAANEKGYLDEVIKCFEVSFNENQKGIQHEVIDTALVDLLQNYHTDPSNIERGTVKSEAVTVARESLHEYVNEFIDNNINFSDLPDESEFGFGDERFNLKEKVFEGYWDDTGTFLIEQYKSS